MDTTIRNLDEDAYRALRARAVMERKTVGALVTEAIRGYLARPAVRKNVSTLRLLHPQPFPPGNERLSMEIDDIVYRNPR
jgi:plasmid stability protein